MVMNIGAFAALADPTRRSVVELLARGPMRAGELAGAARTSPPAMSRHLRVLLRAGLIVDQRDANDARLRLFRLRPDGFASLRSWLDELQADWDDQMMSFKRHAEMGRPQ